jgi:hypothetical protein
MKDDATLTLLFPLPSYDDARPDWVYLACRFALEEIACRYRKLTRLFPLF